MVVYSKAQILETGVIIHEGRQGGWSLIGNFRGIGIGYTLHNYHIGSGYPINWMDGLRFTGVKSIYDLCK